MFRYYTVIILFHEIIRIYLKELSVSNKIYVTYKFYVRMKTIIIIKT